MKNNMIKRFKKPVLCFSISMIPIYAFAENADVLSAVKSYAFKDGNPYSISQIYNIDEPKDGFPPYYIYLNLEKENAYPFVVNMEGVKRKSEPYTRCNVAFKTKGKTLIPRRKYNSGFAEDFEPCLGVSEGVQVIKVKGGSSWFLTKAVYKIENGATEITEEVYFYTDNKFCFSQGVSSSLASGEISIKTLKGLSLGNKDFTECSDNK